MFDSRHGGLSPPRLGGVEFLFFAQHIFVFSLWGFLFNDGHIQNISLFDIFFRECMGPWYSSFKYTTRRFVNKSRTANRSLFACMNAGPNYR